MQTLIIRWKKGTNAPIKFQFSMGIPLIRSQMDSNLICADKDKVVVSLCFHDHDNIHLLTSNGWDIELRFLVYYITAQLHESDSNENICQLSPNNRPIWNSSSWNPIFNGIYVVRANRENLDKEISFGVNNLERVKTTTERKITSHVRRRECFPNVNSIVIYIQKNRARVTES